MLVEHHFNSCLCASLICSYTCVPLIRIQGFHLTPDTNCQLARCMVKLGRKATAEELFSTVSMCEPRWPCWPSDQFLLSYPEVQPLWVHVAGSGIN